MSLVQLLRHLRKSAVLRSVGWQILGSAATLGTALWISWSHGLEAQGEFGLIKSWFDAATAIGALGLPHGLLHLMYRRGISAQQLLPWLRRILTVAAILCLPTAIGAAAFGQQTPALIFASLPLPLRTSSHAHGCCASGAKKYLGSLPQCRRSCCLLQFCSEAGTMHGFYLEQQLSRERRASHWLHTRYGKRGRQQGSRQAMPPKSCPPPT